MKTLPSWIEPVVSTAEAGLRLAALATPPAALLAAVVLTINLACRRWLTAGQLGLLWALVLLRLILPAAPQSIWSLQRFAPLGEQPAVVKDLEALASDAATIVPSNLPPTNEIAPPAVNHPSATSAVATGLPSVKTALSVAWLCGAITVAALTALGQWRLRRELYLAPRCSDRRLTELWTNACGIAGMRRVPEIALFSSIQQPAVVGFLRPRLLLPEDAETLSDEQLRMVMLHELAHLRRQDLAANWLLALVRAMQWWNPIYWLAAQRFASLREQACDAFVASRISETQRRAYGELLVTMAARQPIGARWRVALQASMLGLLSSSFHRAIRRRLLALNAWQARRTRWQTLGAAALIMLLSWCGLTDAPILDAQAAQRPLTIAEWMSRPREGGAATVGQKASAESVVTISLHQGPLVARTYDLTRVFQQLAIDEPDVAPTLGLKSLISLMFDPPKPAYHTPPPSFDPLQQPKHRFRIEGVTLHAFAPESLHEELAACLAAWGDGGLTQISLETRFIRSTRDLAADVGLSWQHFETFTSDQSAAVPLPSSTTGPLVNAATAIDEHLSTVVSKLDEAQATAFIEAAQGNPTTNLFQFPKPTVFNGQTATLMDGSSRSFVVGVNYIEGAAGSSGARQPKIENVEIGTRIRFRLTHSTDRKRVELKAHIHAAEVEHVAETTAIHRGEAITIQNPRVKRRDVTVAEELADGESLLVGYLSAADQGEVVYVLLTPRTLVGQTFRAKDEAMTAAKNAPAGR